MTNQEEIVQLRQELGAADAHAAELRAMLAADAAAIRQARIDELEWAFSHPDFDDLKGRIAQLKKEQADVTPMDEAVLERVEKQVNELESEAADFAKLGMGAAKHRRATEATDLRAILSAIRAHGQIV